MRNHKRQGESKIGRPLGVHDIRTLRTLKQIETLRALVAVPKSRSIRRSVKPARQARGEPARERPRAWIFVKRRSLERYQAMLSVDPRPEPDVELFADGQAIVVLAEFPGVRDGDIDAQVNGDILALSTQPTPPDWRRYYRELLLPFSVAPQTVQRAFRNGVLELEIQRAPSIQRGEP